MISEVLHPFGTLPPSTLALLADKRHARWQADSAGNIVRTRGIGELFNVNLSDDNSWNHTSLYAIADQKRISEQIRFCLDRQHCQDGQNSDTNHPLHIRLTDPTTPVVKVAEYIYAALDPVTHKPVCHGLTLDMTEEDDAHARLQMYSQILDSLPVAVYITHRDGTFKWANQRTEAINGKAPGSMVGEKVSDIVSAGQLPIWEREHEEFFTTGEDRLFESMLTTTHGKLIDVHTVRTAYYDEQGEITGHISCGRDITELQQHRRLLKTRLDENEAYKTSLDNLPTIVFAKDRHGNFLMRNAAFSALQENLAGKMGHQYNSLTEFEHLVDQLKLVEWEGIVKPESYSRNVQLQVDNEFIYFQAQVSPIVTNTGSSDGRYVVSMYNITLVKQLETQLRQLAETDPLTGVLNRRSLLEAAEAKVDFKSEEAYLSPAIVFFDLDNFKQINDTYGHEIGDSALIEVTRAIAANIRQGDILGRWGGEEFVLILQPETNINVYQIYQLVERLRMSIEAIDLRARSGKPIALTASFGIAENESTSDLSTLLARADAATYAAKRAGRNQVMIWNQSLSN